jgi:hypothetical protein
MDTHRIWYEYIFDMSHDISYYFIHFDQRIQYPIQDNMFQYDLVRTHFWFVYDTVICSFQLVDTLEDTQIIVADPRVANESNSWNASNWKI